MNPIVTFEVPSASGIFFLPWVGVDYGRDPEQTKILILGESHYIWDKATDMIPTLTSGIIQSIVDGNYRSKYWSGLERAVSGYMRPKNKKGEFWSQVAYYNFVQEAVGDGPRERPTGPMWEQARPGFLNLLNLLQPDVILVFGLETWRNLPPPTREGDIVDGCSDVPSRVYVLDGAHESLAVAVPHASSFGFSGAKWYPGIVNALETARNRKMR